MSLVVGWLTENFVAVASDGRAIAEDESGKVSLAGEDVPEFHLFTPEIIIAAARNKEFFNVLVRSLQPLVEQSRDDQHLFEYLTAAIPLAARGLGPRLATHNEALLLTGYDPAQKRFRCLRWNTGENFIEHEILQGRVLVMGFGEASETLARRLAVARLSEIESLDEVRATLEEVIREVSRLVPEHINGNVTSCLIYREKDEESTFAREASG